MTDTHHQTWDNSIQKILDIEYHRRAALHYDEIVTRHFRFYHVHSLHPWIEQLVGRTPSPEVLDIGTGTGVVACALAERGCSVRALDHSPEMLSAARARADSLGVSARVRFDLGDGEHLPYPDAIFDAVTIQGVLHHLLEIRPMLREADRVLRPGGLIYISEPCSEGTLISRVINRLTIPLRWVGSLLPGRADRPPNASDHETRVSGRHLVAVLESMGFEVGAEYLVHIGMVRFLPERWRVRVVLALSWPTRRRKGDLIFLTARKPVRRG